MCKEFVLENVMCILYLRSWVARVKEDLRSVIAHALEKVRNIPDQLTK